MFWSVVLWALGAFLLFWFFAMLMALPRAVGSLVDRPPRKSALQRFVDERNSHLSASRQDRK